MPDLRITDHALMRYRERVADIPEAAIVAALPPRMREIGAERGFLRLHDDGVYRVRPAVSCGTKGDSDREAQVVG